MSFFIDDKHYYYKEISELTANIIFNNEFKMLFKELELFYVKYDIEKPSLLAFQDAFYSFMIQMESNYPLTSF